MRSASILGSRKQLGNSKNKSPQESYPLLVSVFKIFCDLNFHLKNGISFKGPGRESELSVLSIFLKFSLCVPRLRKAATLNYFE